MLKWINKKRNKKGFTLVELVVVIAILAILAAIAIPKLGSSRDTAKIATHNANVRILKSAGAMYLADYPNIADNEDINNEIANYLDGGEMPTLPTGLKDSEGNPLTNTEYKVSLSEGNIVVEPEEVKPEED